MTLEAEQIIKAELDGLFYMIDRETGAVKARHVRRDFIPKHNAISDHNLRFTGENNGTYKPWSPELDNLLIETRNSGQAWSDVSIVVGRGKNTCIDRYRLLCQERSLTPVPNVSPKRRRPVEPVARSPVAQRDIMFVSSPATAFGSSPPKLAEILEAVCSVMMIGKPELLSKRREKRVVRARHIYFWIAKTYTSSSFPEMARRCGNRDHSTAMHGVEKVKYLIEDYQSDIARVLSHLMRDCADNELQAV
jgi:hypothetical protein